VAEQEDDSPRLPTRECATSGTLARPGIRRRQRREAGDGAARGRAGYGAARGEQGTMAVPVVRPASAASPGLARLGEREKAWEERDGRRLKKPMMCGSWEKEN
jgi:hypothetical protein